MSTISLHRLTMEKNWDNKSFNGNIQLQDENNTLIHIKLEPHIVDTILSTLTGTITRLAIAAITSASNSKIEVGIPLLTAEQIKK